MKPLTSRLLLALLLLTGLLLLGIFPRFLSWLREQDHPPRAPAPGLLLVARPGSVDRNFDKTVVLLVKVGPERTWGLVLNRLRTPQDEALPADASRWGGPARPEHRTTLLRAEEPSGETPRLLPGLAWHEGPAREGARPGSVLTFTGIAAWRPGQLERELEQGGWLLEEGSAEKVFSDPAELWAGLVSRHR